MRGLAVTTANKSPLTRLKAERRCMVNLAVKMASCLRAIVKNNKMVRITVTNRPRKGLPVMTT